MTSTPFFLILLGLFANRFADAQDFTCIDKPNGNYPNPTECKSFYRCNNGTATLYQCPAPGGLQLHFNPNLSICDMPESAGCTSDPTTMRPTPPPPTTTTARPPTNDFNCTGVANGLFPNIQDCNSYFRCMNQLAYLYNCPTGLHFNPSLRMCDWPYSAGCEATTVDPGTGTPSTTQPSTVTSTPLPTDGSTTGLTDLPSTTPSTNGTTGLTEIPSTTTSPTDSTGLPTNTPPTDGTTGLPTRPTDGASDLTDIPSTTSPTNATTGLTEMPSTTTSPTNGTEIPSTTTSPTDSTGLPTNTPPTDGTTGLPTRPTDGPTDMTDTPSTVPSTNGTTDLPSTTTSPTDSTGLPTNTPPTDGTTGLPTRPTDGPTETDLTEIPSTTTSPTGLPSTTLSSTDGATDLPSTPPSTNETSTLPPPDFCWGLPCGVYPDPNSCDSFILCSESNTTYHTCPSPLRFNKDTLTCDFPDRVPCSSFCDGLGNGLYRNDDNCRTFIMCSRGNTHLFTCPPGHVFNYIELFCDFDSFEGIYCSNSTTTPQPIISSSALL